MFFLLAALITGYSAYDFTQSVGVNLHIDQTVGQWQNYDFLERFLKSLGIKTVRSSGTIYGDSGAHMTFLNQLNTDLGITSDEIFGPQTSSLGEVGGVIRGRKGLKYIEGPNELDICCHDAAWVQDDQRVTTLLSIARSIDPTVDLIAPSVSISDPALLGSLAQQVQAGNAHIYTGARNPETPGWGGSLYGAIYGSVEYAIAQARRSAPGLPVTATEGGYTSATVSEATQASYDERMALWSFLHGITKLWIYDLVDDSQSYGLARIDGSMKPAAYGMQGLLTTLADKAPVAGSCSLNATITTTVTYQTALLCKSSGERDLILWQPAILQNPDNGTPFPCLTAPVHVEVPDTTALKGGLASGSTGNTLLYSQSPDYHWSHTTSPAPAAVDATLTERPLIIAFGAHPITGIPLPILGTGLINGKPIPPGNAKITPLF